jgi:membrane associated rhomboid family serine protease
MPEQPCAFHPDRLTMVTCSSCDRPICPDDMIPAPVGNQCPVCAGRMRDTAIGQASYRVRTTVERTPVGRALARGSVTKLLLGANVAVFLILLAGGLLSNVSGAGDRAGNILIRMGALVVICIRGEGCGLPSSEWWRLFTAMFVHINLLHIAFNMWALYSFGPLIEERYGKVRFLALYLASGFLGSAFSLALNHEQGIRAGASGAIFGILGAWIALFFRHRHLSGARAQLQSLLFLVGINLFLGFSLSGRIDNYAHLGGLAGGMVIGAALEASIRAPREIRTAVVVGGYAAVLGLGTLLTLANMITLPT